MTEYRTHLKIVGEILTTTMNTTDYDEGTSVTHIIRNANVSHSRLSLILHNLVSQGLLEQINSNKSSKYKISPSGREFLSAYKTFRDFSEDFGLSI